MISYGDKVKIKLETPTKMFICKLRENSYLWEIFKSTLHGPKMTRNIMVKVEK